jgi:hypothetical protein
VTGKNKGIGEEIVRQQGRQLEQAHRRHLLSTGARGRRHRPGEARAWAQRPFWAQAPGAGRMAHKAGAGTLRRKQVTQLRQDFLCVWLLVLISQRRLSH